MPVHFPFAVTEDDWWVSLPLEGLTHDLLWLGVYTKTNFTLDADALDTIVTKARREQDQRCKYCTRRMPARLFLVLKPYENSRLLGFVVCESCADQFKADVALKPTT